MHSRANTRALLSGIASDAGAWENVAGAQSVEEPWPCLRSVHTTYYILQWWFAQISVQISLLEEGRPRDQ